MKVAPLFLLLGTVVVLVFVFFIWPARLTGQVLHDDITTIISLEPEFAYMQPGDTAILGVKLVQTGGIPRRDVIIHSLLVDSEGAVAELASQTLAVETQASIVLSLAIPPTSHPGVYTVIIEVRDLENGTLLSSASQRIIVEANPRYSPDSENKRTYFIAFGILAVAIVFFVVLFWLFLRKMHHVLRESSEIISRKSRREFVKRKV